MRFVEINRNEMPNRLKKTKLLKIIEEFYNSDAEVARIEDWNHCSAGACAGALNKSAKHFGYASVKAFSFKGNVYIEKVRL